MSKSRLLPLSDLIIAFSSVWISFVVRLGSGVDLRRYAPLILLMAAIAAGIKPLILWLSGVYRIYWRYVGGREVRRLGMAMVIGSVAWVMAFLLVRHLASVPMFPRSIIVIDLVVSLTLVSLVRKIAYLSGIPQPGDLAG